MRSVPSAQRSAHRVTAEVAQSGLCARRRRGCQPLATARSRPRSARAPAETVPRQANGSPAAAAHRPVPRQCAQGLRPQDEPRATRRSPDPVDRLRGSQGQEHDRQRVVRCATVGQSTAARVGSCGRGSCRHRRRLAADSRNGARRAREVCQSRNDERARATSVEESRIHADFAGPMERNMAWAARRRNFSALMRDRMRRCPLPASPKDECRGQHPGDLRALELRAGAVAVGLAAPESLP